jgi:hypothetical protein
MPRGDRADRWPGVAELNAAVVEEFVEAGESAWKKSATERRVLQLNRPGIRGGSVTWKLEDGSHGTD